MLKILALTAALVVSTVPLIAQDSQADGAVIRRVGQEDQIVRIRAKIRHTTVIVLPQRKTCSILLSEIPNTGT